MSIFDDLLNVFGISSLSSASTFSDLMVFIVSVFVSVFLVSLIIKGVFFVCTLPNKKIF